jgi:DNA-binding HxlR family transcriptional regulator
MTNKEKILRYLRQNGWVHSYELQRNITDRVSPATIDRLLRQMAEDGILEKRYDGKYVEFRVFEKELKLF